MDINLRRLHTDLRGIRIAPHIEPASNSYESTSNFRIIRIKITPTAPPTPHLDPYLDPYLDPCLTPGAEDRSIQ
eukprot:5683670-Pyramimonas_sp.AAC.2